MEKTVGATYISKAFPGGEGGPPLAVDEGNRHAPNNTGGAQMQPKVDDMHANAW